MSRRIGLEEYMQMEEARRRARGGAGAGRAQPGTGRGQMPEQMMSNVQPGQPHTPPPSSTQPPWVLYRSPTIPQRQTGLPPTPEQIRFGAPYGSRQPFSSPIPIGRGVGGLMFPMVHDSHLDLRNHPIIH